MTYPEMRVLHRGYEVAHEQAELEAKGVSQGDQRAFAEFSDDVNRGEWHTKHGAAP